MSNKYDWDAIRENHPLVEVIGSVVPLKQRGKEFVGCCPFHDERTPSFHVIPDKGFYHCFSGETVVMTKRGRQPIRDMSGGTHSLLSRNGLWIDAPVQSFGVQPLMRISLSRNGVRKDIFATRGHRWLVFGRQAAVTTEGLRAGHRLESALPLKRPDVAIDPAGVRHGIVFGDGTLQNGRYGTVNLHGNKDAELVEWFPDQKHGPRVSPNGQKYIRVYGGRAFSHMKSPPSRGHSDEYMLGFLAGYFAADGHVAKDGTVMLNSATRSNLEWVRDTATRLGIVTMGVTTQSRSGFGAPPSDIHRIHFAASTLPDRFLLLAGHRMRHNESVKKFERLRWTVTGISETDRVEEVFCAMVPAEHCFALDDNILTGNCFGCNAHGDVIDFVANTRGIPVEQAIEILTGSTDAHVIEVSAEDRLARRAVMEQREERQAKDREAAIRRAVDRWDRADRPAPADHSYLVRKGVEPHTCRIENDKLLLPIYGSDGGLQSVQTIAPDGAKLFQSGAPTKAGRMMIGLHFGRTILCEGFATGASIHAAVPDQVCVTFSKGNMAVVAREMAADGVPIVLAADANAKDEMIALAAELDCPVAWPEGAPAAGDTETPAIGDFNDQHKVFGDDNVAATFMRALRTYMTAKQAEEDERKADTAPVDLWAQYDPPALPTGLLPPLLEVFAHERAEQMGVDPGGLAMSAVTVCAAAIRDSIKIKVKKHENWTESARIWTMLIGDPSFKKSPIMRAAAGKIKHMDADLLREGNKKMQDWQENGGSKGGGEMPACPRLRVEDITMEAAQEVCRHSPDGILVLQDELSGWFGGIEKYSGGKGSAKDRSFWLTAFGGGQYAVNRVGRGSFLIDNLSVTILGGVQPDPIRRIVADASDDGLIQRFFPIVLRPAQLGKDEVSGSASFDFDSLVERLHALKAPDSIIGHVPLQFSDEARAVRERLEARHHKQVAAIEGFNKKLAAHIGKFDGLFARLCIVWHCIEHIEEKALPIVVTGDTASRVAEFLSGYLMKHSLCFYTNILGLDDGQDITQDVAGYILSKRLDVITMRALERSVRSFRSALKDERTRVMEQLEAFGWIHPQNRRSDAASWAVSPEVHTMFEDKAKSERQRRNEIRQAIIDLAEV